MILRAYKTELDPTAEQRRALARHVAGARIAHNWVLEKWIELDVARAVALGVRALAGYDTRGGEAACYLAYALAALLRGREVKARTPKGEPQRFRYAPAPGAQIPDFRASTVDWYTQLAHTRDEQPERFGWFTELSAFAIREAVLDVGDGWKHFFEHLRAGRYDRAGRPRFRNRRYASYHVDQPNPIRVTEKTVTIPSVGEVRLKERGYLPATHTDSHRFPQGGKAIGLGLSEKDGRWYVALRAEALELPPQPRGPGKALRDHPVPRIEGRVVGVEVGVVNLAVATTGERSANIAHVGLRDSTKIQRLERLRKLWERRMARRWRPGVAIRNQSSGWREARARVAHYYARITFARDDLAGKTVRQIVDAGAETVRMRPPGSVQSMLSRERASDARTRNRLAPKVHAARMGDVRRRLEYKQRWAGGKFETVPQEEPVTKRCSACSTVRETPPTYPNFKCPNCGHAEDRDDNAATNLLQYSSGGNAGEAGPRSAGSKPPKWDNGRRNRMVRAEEQSEVTTPNRPGNRVCPGAPRSARSNDPHHCIVSEIERRGDAQFGSQQFRRDTACPLADEGDRSQTASQAVEMTACAGDPAESIR